ncbi:MAG: type I-C CRISPR-associated protein Cas8c/Csd1 [Firmicutes bacterium]|nr:type I-C CRISPR-associated protein Cas8c/Csd1 [Bacillota bacterium]
MSWIQKLYETYENCQSMVGKSTDDNNTPLLPICHTTQIAQIEVTIDQEGNFKRARVVPKDDAKTIIPCTEDSGGRTSGLRPHPLCDKLQYVAADYQQYGGSKKPCFRLDDSPYGNNDIETEYFKNELEGTSYISIKEFFDKYKKKLHEIFSELVKIPNLVVIINRNESIEKIREGSVDTETIIKNKYKLIDIFPKTLQKTITYEYLLERWCASEHSHPKAEAVLKYVKKGTVVKDLIDSKVLFVGENGKLLKKWDKKQKDNIPDIFKLSLDEQADAFVRWIVEIPNDPQSAVWLDMSLYESWIKYYSSTKKTKTLCYVVGTDLLEADQHPKKLRNDTDSAKLISANDTSGFTFRGRFLTAGQACGVSLDISQKSHLALRWLIERQGKVFYEGKRRTPGLTIVAWAITGEQIPDPLADSFSIMGFDKLESDSEPIASNAQDLALRLKKKISGYSVTLGDTTGVVVMGLDSATPGRMSITFYRELTGSDFLARVENWHQTCCWIHNYRPKEIDVAGKKKTIYIQFVGAPAPSDIAEAAYGSKVDDRLRNATVERILPCIIDGQKIPRDLVESVVRQASNRIAMENWEWNKTLSIACALYRKYHEKEEYDMALDENRTTRDYLYGRLLALADNLEQWALSKANEDRPTTAARLMQRFADHPYTTWRTIELSLQPYKARLGAKSLSRQRLISEVTTKFKPDDYTNDKKLSGEFLLGYHCQREALRSKEKEEDPEEGMLQE